MSKTKNFTVTLTQEEHEDLDYLVNYFQSKSIATVTKSDVIKFMIRQMKETVSKDVLSEVQEVIENAPEVDEA
ncbi:hypothetical protein [Bacillus licheniformis]|uniref:hypothetical protein n=1 Tax=Bacillus licheniformis TaxID=1402 RepID=UPI0031F5756E